MQPKLHNLWRMDICVQNGRARGSSRSLWSSEAKNSAVNRKLSGLRLFSYVLEGFSFKLKRLTMGWCLHS